MEWNYLFKKLISECPKWELNLRLQVQKSIETNPMLDQPTIFGFLCVNKGKGRLLYRPLAHDVTAPVMMHLEDKLAIYA
jgi:hypothetical protein